MRYYSYPTNLYQGPFNSIVYYYQYLTFPAYLWPGSKTNFYYFLNIKDFLNISCFAPFLHPFTNLYIPKYLRMENVKIMN